MKHHAVLGIIIIVILLVPLLSYARLGIGNSGITSRGLGGVVLITGKEASAVLTCTARYGPIVIKPVVPIPPGPYHITAGTNGAPKTSGWILGNFNFIPSFGTCYSTQTGIPVPSFSISPYGVSK